jgi:putative colanic acid biosynthesis acetyltransferase WcaF
MKKNKKDPFKNPTYSIYNRAIRASWIFVWIFLFRPSPKFMYFWRVWLLKIFGAKMGVDCVVHRNVKVWAPWNLYCEDVVTIADGVEVYNPAPIFLKSHAILSQGAYMCGASHDINSKDFRTVVGEIIIGEYAWVCARATVMAGVSLGDGAVLALGSVATKDVPAWEVHGGLPARRISTRNIK